MNNTVRISACFDFKGETHRPTVTLDLDAILAHSDTLPDCYQLLARENGIGLYSYELEVLESAELLFSDATGLAAEFLHDGTFDFEAFRNRWQAQQQLAALEELAREHLGIDDLQQQPGLQQALLAAYELGRGERES